MRHLSLPVRPGKDEMPLYHLCTARSLPFIVGAADTPALPPLPEFEDKWPNFLLSPPSATALSSLPDRIREQEAIYSIEQTMPLPALSPPRRRRNTRYHSTSKAADVWDAVSLSPTGHLLTISPPSNAPSLREPSAYSSSEENEDDDYDASATTLWNSYYNFTSTTNASDTNLYISSRNQSPFIYEVEPSTLAPLFSPRPESRPESRTSHRATQRCQTAPPLHLSLPHRRRPHPSPAFRHHPTPPLPPPSSPQSALHALKPPPRSFSPSINLPSPSLSLFPSAPRTYTPRSLALSNSQPPGLTEKSVWDHEDGESSGLKGVRAIFHVRGSTGVQGGRRRSAGEIVKSIFGGRHEKGEKRV